MMVLPYEYCFLIAIAAYTYSVLLTDTNMILSGVYKWLYTKFKTDERNENGQPVHWLFMILMYCEKCVAGQWAFWYFIYRESNSYLHKFSFDLLVTHLFFVLTTIFFTYLISILINKIRWNTNN